jgi:hypothetical protein
MREYSDKISLTKNSRGIYSLDTSIGCATGMTNEVGGCYNDCYASKSAKIYGYDFSKTVLRYFKDKKHRDSIYKKINSAKLDFIRIGCSGDPSENWHHMISIIDQIKNCNKQIVIITRHWTILTDTQLDYLSKLNICFNSSVSALDTDFIRNNSLTQYERIKHYCKSILRVVSCDFNLNNSIGHEKFKIQSELFKNENTIDTVFRPNKKNRLIIDGVINIKKEKFMNSLQLVSKFNRSAYLGKCGTCHEMCGVNLKVENKLYPDNPGIVKQLPLFRK